VISGLLNGSPRTKSHSDATPTEWCKIYYMGEGGGFPWVWAVVSLVSPRLPVAHPSTKGAPTFVNQLVCWICARLLEWVNCLSFFLVPFQSSNTPLYPFKVPRAGNVPRAPNLSVVFHTWVQFESTKGLGSASVHHANTSLLPLFSKDVVGIIGNVWMCQFEAVLPTSSLGVEFAK
jgi:hypothetical protein